MATVGERDRARGSEVSRPRSEARAEKRYHDRDDRKAARAARGEPARLDEATSISEAMDIERDNGRREGAASRTQRPVTRIGDGARPPEPRDGPDYQGPNLAAGTTPSIGGPLIFETIIIAADEFVNQHRFPIPSRLLIAWGAFTVLGLARGNAARAATALAWGLVASSFYATVSPASTPAGLGAIRTVGDFIGGKYGGNGATSSTGGPPIVGTPGTQGNAGGQKVSVGNGQRVS